jgi:hypothetical protein
MAMVSPPKCPKSGQNVGDHCARTEKTRGTKADKVYDTLNSDFSTNHATLTNVVFGANGRGAGELINYVIVSVFITDFCIFLCSSDYIIIFAQAKSGALVDGLLLSRLTI